MHDAPQDLLIDACPERKFWLEHSPNAAEPELSRGSQSFGCNDQPGVGFALEMQIPVRHARDASWMAQLFQLLNAKIAP